MEEELLSPASRPSLIRRAALLQESLADLLRIVQYLDRKRAERYGLSVSQLHGLVVLGKAGPMPVTRFGYEMQLEKSTASRLAKGLLRKDLLRKRSLGSDDRKVILQVTEQGMRLLRKIGNDLSEAYIDILVRMEPAERETLPASLTLLSRALQARASRPDRGSPEREPDLHQSRRTP
jgi:DNA-binding MarR family transcriptional regulator